MTMSDVAANRQAVILWRVWSWIAYQSLSPEITRCGRGPGSDQVDTGGIAG
ncbi:MAG: hypothetical protein AAGL90_04130 [Pseudomonadota bacterium]